MIVKGRRREVRGSGRKGEKGKVGLRVEKGGGKLTKFMVNEGRWKERRRGRRGVDGRSKGKGKRTGWVGDEIVEGDERGWVRVEGREERGGGSGEDLEL